MTRTVINTQRHNYTIGAQCCFFFAASSSFPSQYFEYFHFMHWKFLICGNVRCCFLLFSAKLNVFNFSAKVSFIHVHIKRHHRLNFGLFFLFASSKSVWLLCVHFASFHWNFISSLLSQWMSWSEKCLDFIIAFENATNTVFSRFHITFQLQKSIKIIHSKTQCKTKWMFELYICNIEGKKNTQQFVADYFYFYCVIFFRVAAVVAYSLSDCGILCINRARSQYGWHIHTESHAHT